MKILLTTNKTLSNEKGNKWVDSGYYNIYLPLKDLGHEVYFWDTVDPEQPDYQKVVDNFKPDLIFACITGDLRITPAEQRAVEIISRITQSGNIKTFNWFCDDSWRFDDWSTIACRFFTCCSTSEPSYIQRYKDIGYDNIMVGGWHTNQNFYPEHELEKKYDVTFIGQTKWSPDRKMYLNFLKEKGINVQVFHGLDQKDMVEKLCQSKVGINFSKNYTSVNRGQSYEPKTQMKLRPFEIAAAKGTMIFSEYHDGLEHFFDIDKEMVCFEGRSEMLHKIKFILEKDNIRKKIARNGNIRFEKEHSSHQRLKAILGEISKI